MSSNISYSAQIVQVMTWLGEGTMNRTILVLLGSLLFCGPTTGGGPGGDFAVYVFVSIRRQPEDPHDPPQALLSVALVHAINNYSPVGEGWRLDAGTWACVKVLDGVYRSNRVHVAKSDMKLSTTEPGGRECISYLYPLLVTDNHYYLDCKKESSPRDIQFRGHEEIRARYFIPAKNLRWISWDMEISSPGSTVLDRYGSLRIVIQPEGMTCHVSGFSKDGKQTEEFTSISGAYHGKCVLYGEGGASFYWHGHRVTKEEFDRKTIEEQHRPDGSAPCPSGKRA
jgi:hypothetical protein